MASRTGSRGVEEAPERRFGRRRLTPDLLRPLLPNAAAFVEPIVPVNGEAPSEAAPADVLPTSVSAHSVSHEGVEARTLIIGRGTAFSGNIANCDRLIVDGSARAQVKTCGSLIVTRSGSFEGSIAADHVQVRGRFSGTLTARKHLIIHQGGLVSGTVRYAAIEIELGGKIQANIKSHAETRGSPPDDDQAARPAERVGRDAQDG